MFEELMAEGSVVAVVLMAYAFAVMLEANRITNDPLDMPRAMRHPLAQIAFMGATPLTVWPAIYVGLFEGWLIGTLTFLILIPIAVVIFTTVLRIRGMIFGFHFMAASVLYPIGYVLSALSLMD